MKDENKRPFCFPADGGAAEEDCYNLELKEALFALSEKYRIVMTLFYGEGYHIEEIAAMLKIPKSTVQTRLHRARKKLEEYYLEEGRKEQTV